MAGFGRGEQRGERLVALFGSVQVFDEAREFGGVFTRGEPVTQQGVAGDVGRSHQRLAEHALDVVTDRFDAGWQGSVDQVAVGEAVERHGEDNDHHQDARQQGSAHAGDQLQLDALTPDTHAPTPPHIIVLRKVYTLAYSVNPVI
ncbi:hypothetical protein D9M71_549710 [compost metagenome]